MALLASEVASDADLPEVGMAPDAAPEAYPSPPIADDGAPAVLAPAGSSVGGIEGTQGRIPAPAAAPDEGAHPGDAPAAVDTGASRSPAEAFRELAREVGDLSVRVQVVTDFVQRSASEALESARALRSAGERAAIDSLLRVHRSIFRIQASRLGLTDPGEADKVLDQLRLEVEDQMAAFDILAEEPRVGAPLDRQWMAARVADPRSDAGDAPGAISRVMSCGYFQRDGSERRVYQQAEVAVFSEE